MNVETQKCRDCGSQFAVSPEEATMYAKLEMPLPVQCFYCRMQQLFAFWPFGRFRAGKSDLSGKDLITMLPAHPRYPIYTREEWYSDAWTPPELEYNPSRPFLDQLKELQEKTPRPHQQGSSNTNSQWCDDVWQSKNCYLCRSILKCEDCGYLYRIFGAKDSFDLAYCFDIEKSYDLTYCFNCFNVRHALHSRDCAESIFLYDCRNCQNCFMCWNLRGKQYYIRNKAYSKEDYAKVLAEYNLGSRKIVAALRQEFWGSVADEAFHRTNFNVNVSESTGNYLVNCSRCVNCYYFEQSEDCYNCMRGLKNKTSVEIVSSMDSELSGATVAAQPGYQVKYCAWIENCSYSEYLDNCVGCGHCFGCVGIKKKKFCILNRQYSEDEYERLRAEIIESMRKDGTWGIFFPYRMAYGGYNLSTAAMYFQKTKTEIEALSAQWEEVGRSSEGIPTGELPDDVKDVKDDLTKQALICAESGYRFNIAPAELKFYREMNVPLPREHFDVRTVNRFRRMAVIKPYQTHCYGCQKSIDAYYDPAWGYKKILCTDCYLKEVY